MGKNDPTSTFEAEQVSDWIACTAGNGPVLLLHVVWFGAWVAVNAGAVRGIHPFDPFPFPFPFLTMTVSLEVIFLTLFVLASRTHWRARLTSEVT
jgi:CRP/FNR family transcriptional regulator, cyclic AMP receptor protein